MNKFFYSFVDFRKNLKAVLDSLTMESEVFVTRHDKPVAVVLSVAAYEKLRLEANSRPK